MRTIFFSRIRSVEALVNSGLPYFDNLFAIDLHAYNIYDTGSWDISNLLIYISTIAYSSDVCLMCMFECLFFFFIVLFSF